MARTTDDSNHGFAALQGPFAAGEAGDGYRRLFSALPLPAVIIDALGFVRLANRQAADLLGLALHAWLQQRSILQFLQPNDRQRLVWRLGDRSSQGVFEIRGVELLTDHATRVPCDVHLVHLEGTVTHEPMSLMVVVDRTLEAEFRWGEQALRRQTQRLADVIWASQSGTWEWTVPSGEVVVNERFAEIVGANVDGLGPLDASTFTGLIHPEDRASMALLASEPRGVGDDSFEVRLRLSHRGGGWIWVLNRGRVLERNHQDRPVRLAGTVLDISNEVEREQSLRAAKEQAEASERMKSEWLANVSHEVRTPLNSVLGLVQLMQEWPADDRQREALARVIESAELLRNTLDDLLDNAKLEAGRMVLEQVPLNLSELAQSVMAVFEQRAQEAGVELTCDLDALVPDNLLGDPLRLRQVINNLVSNALKFTAKGHVDVVVSGHGTSLGSTFELKVEVSDTGVGIGPEQLAQLFKPYFQADASTSRRFGGTGLGLSISQRMVQLMGGRIGVESQPGRGSRFWFTVPLVIDDEREPITPSHPQGSQHWTSRLPVTANPPASEPQTPQDAQAAIGEEALWNGLRQSLLLHDPQAQALCETLMGRHGTGPEAATLRKVLRHVRNFNFETALAELKGPNTPHAGR